MNVKAIIVAAAASILVVSPAASVDTCEVLRARTAAVDRDAPWSEIDYLKSLMPRDCLEAQSKLFYDSDSYLGKRFDDCRPHQETIEHVENTSAVCGCSWDDAMDFWFAMCRMWCRIDAENKKWWKW